MFTCSCIRKLFKKKVKSYDNSIYKDEFYEYANNNKISYDITCILEEEEEQEEEQNIILNKNPNILTIDDFNESL